MQVEITLQFVESGCDNCDTFLSLEGDRGRVHDYTTPNFSGYVCVCDSRHMAPPGNDAVL